MGSKIFYKRERGGRLPPRMVVLSAALGLFSAAMLGGAAIAYRIGSMPLSGAVATLQNGVLIALVALVLGLAALLVCAFNRRTRPALAAVLVMGLTLAMLAVPMHYAQRAQSSPTLNDITTNLEQAPAFNALAEQRRAAPNGLDYPGESSARQQRLAYPDIKPLTVNASAGTVAEAVQAEANKAGWSIANQSDQRLEAVATSFWFGFKDDIVIAWTSRDGETTVDMRSASRVGVSDLGTNARRIGDFMAALENRLDQQ